MPNLDLSVLYHLLWSAIVIGIIYTLKTVFLNILHRHVADRSKYYRAKRVTNAIVFFLLLVLLTLLWFNEGSSVVTFVGLLSAGLALALKDLIMNIAGWLYILIRQPFAVGDRIEIDGTKGDVIDQNLFKFNVMEIGNWVDAEQSTGRVIHIPNYKIFTDPLANYSLGFEYIWNEIPVVITFESDWKKAKTILEDIINAHADDFSERMQKQIREMSKQYMIFYNNLSPIVYTDVLENGVRLTIRFVCRPRQRRGTAERVWEAILEQFAKEPDIALAYPTYRRVDA